MRILLKSCLLSVATVVSATNPNESNFTEDTTAAPAVDVVTESAPDGVEAASVPADTLSSGSDVAQEDTPSDLMIVGMDPLLGEFMTELILNIEKAIDNYAFEVAMAEVITDADTSSAASENATEAQDNVPSTSATSSPTDASSANPTADPSSVNEDEGSTTAPVAV